MPRSKVDAGGGGGGPSMAAAPVVEGEVNLNSAEARAAAVAALKSDKRKLHIMLKNYERQFKEKHGREVSCPEDIAPVESEYQRYKEIKRQLIRIQNPQP
uniref:FAM13A-like domain-containing protein n=1 Tax=Fibrocapsa japonica TaxID=94617 RepID=A0A7S2UXR7_9STRA|mmetsp:Transcript_16063/g.23612  ORF Transcript_16063/g.23612 Transcript_16063/m.23612 type:complete len:100 (+) Transcript_16063:3-302(+)